MIHLLLYASWTGMIVSCSSVLIRNVKHDQQLHTLIDKVAVNAVHSGERYALYGSLRQSLECVHFRRSKAVKIFLQARCLQGKQ